MLTSYETLVCLLRTIVGIFAIFTFRKILRSLIGFYEEDTKYEQEEIESNDY